MRTTILFTFVLGILCSTPVGAAQLSTGYGAPLGGAQSTMLFDIVVQGQDLVLTQVGANMQPDAGAAVYIRPGTHVGHEFSAAGWTQILDDPNVVGNGNGVETVLDVNDFNLSASQTYGIAIIVVDRQEAGQGTGNSPGTVAASNTDLSILEGTLASGNYSNQFGGAFMNTPYRVETTIYYQVAAQAVPLAGSLAPVLAAVLIGAGVWAYRRRRA